MIGSAVVYTGLLIAAAGLVFVVKPIHRLHVTTRGQGLAILGAGVLLAGLGLSLPTSESRANKIETRLDEFVPVWQFSERHTIEIDAPPARVFDAIRRVRADEISLFHALTWIRRGGRPLPQTILDAGNREPIIDVALKGGFVRLADDSVRELVIGTVVDAPPGARGQITPAIFKKPLPPGFALAAMNFLVTPEGPNRSIVVTETRVYANSPGERRKFARYWRLIYPGSAIIRRMWLRAVRRRATS
ncbi:MAG: hypothetical protein DMD72_02380 [Gemmatimonadetes bacterium]|nr:MAG: hypothetical protein DMD72_02380 [Gemmatimonadota bacterium]